MKSLNTLTQPLTVLSIDGALLRLDTLCAIAGESKATLYRAAAAGKLKLVKNGSRYTRIRSQDARAYLESRGVSA